METGVPDEPSSIEFSSTKSDKQEESGSPANGHPKTKKVKRVIKVIRKVVRKGNKTEIKSVELKNTPDDASISDQISNKPKKIIKVTKRVIKKKDPQLADSSESSEVERNIAKKPSSFHVAFDQSESSSKSVAVENVDALDEITENNGVVIDESIKPSSANPGDLTTNIASTSDDSNKNDAAINDDSTEAIASNDESTETVPLLKLRNILDLKASPSRKVRGIIKEINDKFVLFSFGENELGVVSLNAIKLKDQSTYDKDIQCAIGCELECEVERASSKTEFCRKEESTSIFVDWFAQEAVISSLNDDEDNILEINVGDDDICILDGDSTAQGDEPPNSKLMGLKAKLHNLKRPVQDGASTTCGTMTIISSGQFSCKNAWFSSFSTFVYGYSLMKADLMQFLSQGDKFTVDIFSINGSLSIIKAWIGNGPDSNGKFKQMQPNDSSEFSAWLSIKNISFSEFKNWINGLLPLKQYFPYPTEVFQGSIEKVSYGIGPNTGIIKLLDGPHIGKNIVYHDDDVFVGQVRICSAVRTALLPLGTIVSVEPTKIFSLDRARFKSVPVDITHYASIVYTPDERPKTPNLSPSESESFKKRLKKTNFTLKQFLKLSKPENSSDSLLSDEAVASALGVRASKIRTISDTAMLNLITSKKEAEIALHITKILTQALTTKCETNNINEFFTQHDKSLPGHLSNQRQTLNLINLDKINEQKRSAAAAKAAQQAQIICSQMKKYSQTPDKSSIKNGTDSSKNKTDGRKLLNSYKSSIGIVSQDKYENPLELFKQYVSTKCTLSMSNGFFYFGDHKVPIKTPISFQMKDGGALIDTYNMHDLYVFYKNRQSTENDYHQNVQKANCKIIAAQHRCAVWDCIGSGTIPEVTLDDDPPPRSRFAIMNDKLKKNSKAISPPKRPRSPRRRQRSKGNSKRARTRSPADNSQFKDHYDPTEPTASSPPRPVSLSTLGGSSWSRSQTQFKSHQSMTSSLPTLPTSVQLHQSNSMSLYNTQSSVLNQPNSFSSVFSDQLQNSQPINGFSSNFSTGSHTDQASKWPWSQDSSQFHQSVVNQQSVPLMSIQLQRSGQNVPNSTVGQSNSFPHSFSGKSQSSKHLGGFSSDFSG